MRAEVREELMNALNILPIMSTSQVARLLFQDSGSPAKRASQALKELEQEKLVESRRQGDMSRVWRLTRRGRKETQTQQKSTPFSSPKLSHYLAIGDLYIHLRLNGVLRYFEVEPREIYSHLGKTSVYAPDALYIHDKAIYLAEIQISRLSRAQWAAKWRSANTYFNDRHFENASWQRWRKGEYIKPRFIVITPQREDIVREGFDVHGRTLEVMPL